MKYLAILKDSWREALDSKVLYALIILSLLVVIGVASISFKPQPADKGLQDILSRFPGAQASFVNPQPVLDYDLEDFQQLNDRKPWDGEYRFAIAVNERDVKTPDGKVQPGEGTFRLLVWLSALQLEDEKLTAEDREARRRLLALREQAAAMKPEKLQEFLNEKMREEVNQVTPAQMERFIRDQLAAYGTLETTSVRMQPPEEGKDIRFEVEAKARAETFRTWPHRVSYGYGAYTSQSDTPIGNLVYALEDGLIGSFGAGVTMLVASVVTAFFIPNMLRKGTVDLLISKPIHRWALLVYKFIGGLTFMFVTTVVTVVGVWLVLGLRSGMWAPGFLLSIFVLTFQFSIFYAVSTLFGVLTRSPIISILAACGTWVLLWAVGTGHIFLEATRELKLFPDWAYTTVDTAHFILPRYKDLDALNGQLIGRDLLGPDSPERKATDRIYEKITWGSSIGFTLGFIALMLGLSCWRFATRDY
jgi:ABC-type transport system involved in multi-copper enzyme maturation permease subunit